MRKFCEDAVKFDFRSVCIPPRQVKLASEIMFSTNTDVCTVIGFPLGYNCTEIKVAEIEKAFQDGATEMDVVIPIGILKSEVHTALLDEMHKLTELVHRNYGIVKWIVETAYLTKKELVTICNYCMEVKADYIKTSTGFASSGAQLADIKLWKKTIGDAALKIKASGGIKNRADALSFIKAGATRLGCSSGIEIIKG